VLSCLLALALLAPPPSPPLWEAEIAAALLDTAEVWPVPPALVRALIRQESANNPRAVSPVGAKGLMQLMPATALKVGVAEKELFTPARNILAGVRLLATLLRHYRGDVVSALVAYNSGPKAPAVVPANGETPDYVARILLYWRELDPSVGQPPAKKPAPSPRY
jgi:soluble lytic murein transglycosylase-like protein